MSKATLSVRPSDRADIASVDALLARSYPVLLKPDYPPSIMVTALPIISRARPELVTSGTYYVAEQGPDEVIGAGGWTARKRDPRIADIRHVVTDHRYTRQGIGRALFTRIFADAEAAGVQLFDCLSTRTAVPFYAAMGFQELGPIEVTLAQGIAFPAVHMQRPV